MRALAAVLASTVERPASVLAVASAAVVVAIALAPDTALFCVTGPAYPDAGRLCALVAGAHDGQATVPLLAAEPLYLRRPDAREPGPPKRVTQP